MNTPLLMLFKHVFVFDPSTDVTFFELPYTGWSGEQKFPGQLADIRGGTVRLQSQNQRCHKYTWRRFIVTGRKTDVCQDECLGDDLRYCLCIYAWNISNLAVYLVAMPMGNQMHMFLFVCDKPKYLWSKWWAGESHQPFTIACVHLLLIGVCTSMGEPVKVIIACRISLTCRALDQVTAAASVWGTFD